MIDWVGLRKILHLVEAQNGMLLNKAKFSKKLVNPIWFFMIFMN